MSNGRPAMRDYLDAQNNHASERVRTMSNVDLLARSVQEWVDMIVEEYANPEIPIIYPDKITRSTEQGQVPVFQVPNPQYADVPKQAGLVHKFHIPFIGNRNFFFYHPAGWSGTFPGADVLATELVLAIGGSWYTPQAIETEIDDHVADIEKALAGFRADAERFKQDLPGRLLPRLTSRRQVAEAESQTAAALKYPLRRLESAPHTYQLPDRLKPLAPKSVPATSRQPAETEFTLSESDYQEILRICASMSLVMERSPTVFEDAEEEHIRVHYLVQLNGQFQGAATGETFNNAGKTDILIRHQNQNVFVAECKFWGGYKALLETTDQLLGYTTWRDTKTALIIFSRNQDFTSVISEAQRAMKDHPQYKSGPQKEGETRFRYVLRHPDDVQRDIIVTLLLFNMPKPAR